MIAKPKLAASAAALAAGIAIAGGSAVAQPWPSHGDAATVGGVTVYAGHRYVRQPTTGALVEPDTVSLVVSLDDLDLSTRRGARVAVHRIEAAAREACDEVQVRYPKDVDSGRGCYVPAVRGALAQVQDQVGYPILAWGYH